LLILLVIGCAAFGGILYMAFSGILGDEGPSLRAGRGARGGGGGGYGGGGDGVPRMRELPMGCLISLIAAGAIWFILWGIVLILALRLLRTPLGN
jgi:hypothetical protein